MCGSGPWSAARQLRSEQVRGGRFGPIRLKHQVVDLLQCIYQLVEFEDLRWVEHSACLEAVEESLSMQ